MKRGPGRSHRRPGTARCRCGGAGCTDGRPLAEVVAASRAVAATRSRTAKTQALAELFARCDPAEVGVVVSHLSGVLPQRRLGCRVPLARLAARTGRRAEPHRRRGRCRVRRLAATAGAGSTASRKAELLALMGRATGDEQRFLVDLMTGNLRQGALDGVVLAAVATAYAVPAPVVRRAAMLAGTAAEVAALAATGGVEALEQVGLVVGRPVRPMLAASARPPTRRWRRSAAASSSSTASSTASACRCTDARGRSASTRAASTRSPSGCPRSSRRWPRCPGATSCSTARPS